MSGDTRRNINGSDWRRVSLSDIRCYIGGMTTATVHLADQVAANVSRYTLAA